MNTTYAEDILERVRAKQRAQAEKAAREEAERHKARIIIKPKNEDFGKFKPQTVRELIELRIAAPARAGTTHSKNTVWASAGIIPLPSRRKPGIMPEFSMR
jgi:hypothetical protein